MKDVQLAFKVRTSINLVTKAVEVNCVLDDRIVSMNTILHVLSSGSVHNPRQTMFLLGKWLR